MNDDEKPYGSCITYFRDHNHELVKNDIMPALLRFEATLTKVDKNTDLNTVKIKTIDSRVDEKISDVDKKIGGLGDRLDSHMTQEESFQQKLIGMIGGIHKEIENTNETRVKVGEFRYVVGGMVALALAIVGFIYSEVKENRGNITNINQALYGDN